MWFYVGLFVTAGGAYLAVDALALYLVGGLALALILAIPYFVISFLNGITGADQALACFRLLLMLPRTFCI